VGKREDETETDSLLAKVTRTTQSTFLVNEKAVQKMSKVVRAEGDIGEWVCEKGMKHFTVTRLLSGTQRNARL
jgi:hypothetical protein